MPAIKNLARPASQRTDYRFFKNEDSGHKFKAMHALAMNIQNDPTLSVTLSEIGADGKAVPDENGKVHIYPHTHVFTQTELADPDFDPEARLGMVLASAIEAKEQDMASRAALKAMSAKWGASEALRVVPNSPAK